MAAARRPPDREFRALVRPHLRFCESIAGDLTDSFEWRTHADDVALVVARLW
jgi:hypothetical protein